MNNIKSRISLLRLIALFQSAVAFLWLMVRGIGSVDPEIMRAADNFRFDEYTGFICPVFLRLFMNIAGKEIGVYFLVIFQCSIMILALIFCLINVMSFYNRDKKKISRADLSTAVIYIMTFPVILQMATGVSVWPLFITAIFIGLGAALHRSRKVKIGVLIFFIILFLARICLISPGAYNKLPGTLQTAVMINLAGEHLEEDYYFWPDEAKNVVDFEKLSSVVRNREDMVNSLGSIMSKNVSYSEMSKLCFGIGMASITNRSKETIITVIKNFRDNLLFPITIFRNIKGNGKSVTAVRFSEMGGNTISKIYLWIGFGLVFGFLGYRCLDALLFGRKEYFLFKYIAIIFWIFLAAFNSIFTIHYFDYFAMMPALLLAIIFLVSSDYFVNERKEEVINVQEN